MSRRTHFSARRRAGPYVISAGGPLCQQPPPPDGLDMIGFTQLVTCKRCLKLIAEGRCFLEDGKAVRDPTDGR